MREETINVHETEGLRLMRAKTKLRKRCQYCKTEHDIRCNTESKILIAFCKNCGGRQKERYDSKGHKLPPVDTALVVSY